MSLADVYTALKAALTLPNLTEPNQLADFEDNGTYVRATILENIPTALALNSPVMTRSGFFQIDIFTALNTGQNEALLIAQNLSDIFKRNSMFGSILIKYCTTEPGRIEGKKYWCVPVLVSWETQY